MFSTHVTSFWFDLAFLKLLRMCSVVLLVNAPSMGARLIGGASVSAARLDNFHEGNGSDSNVIGISVAELGKEPVSSLGCCVFVTTGNTDAVHTCDDLFEFPIDYCQ